MNRCAYGKLGDFFFRLFFMLVKQLHILFWVLSLWEHTKVIWIFLNGEYFAQFVELFFGIMFCHISRLVNMGKGCIIP